MAEARGGRTHASPQNNETKAASRTVESVEKPQTEAIDTPCASWAEFDDGLHAYRRFDGLLFDADDFWKVSGPHAWVLDRGYARAYFNGKNQYLHRYLLGADVGQVVDHINGNPLDCRRANLRLTDKYGNSRNRRMASKNRVGFKGVDLRLSGRYRAKIRKNGKTIHVGYFDTPEAAALAYDAAALQHFGEFARLNFPQTAPKPLHGGGAA